MSSSTPNQEATNPYLINPYAKTTSRLVRSRNTNQESSGLSKPTESAITQPSLLTRKGRNEPVGHHVQRLLPSHVSEISSNIIFQDVDSSKKPFSRTSVYQQSDNKDKEVKPQAIGLISNALMGATTKYSKVSQQNMTTPTKNSLPQQVITPNHSETETNTHSKFARRREVQPPKVERHSAFELDLNIAKVEAKEEGFTERSVNESSRKIERKTDRYRRQTKFAQKKQTKQEGDSQTLSQLGQNSRILDNDSSTITHQQTYNEQQQQVGTPIIKPRPSPSIIPAKQQSKSVVLAGRQEVVQSKQLIKLQPITAPIVKKSALVSYTIKRLLVTQLSSTFSRLKQANLELRIKATRQSNLMGQAVMSIYRSKQMGLMRWSFEQLKNKFAQKYLPQLKQQLLYRQPNRTQIGVSLLQKIYRSQLHTVMRKLRHKFLWCRQQAQSFSILDRIIKKKSAQIQHLALLALTGKAKTKHTLLNNFNRIIINFNKYKVGLALIKIQGSAKPIIERTTPQKKMVSNSSLKELTPKSTQPDPTPIPTNPALVDKTEKLRAMVNSVRDNLAMITHKLKEAELQSKQQRQELQQKVISLKQNNQQVESELQGKKSRISAIQNQLNSITSKLQPKTIEDQLEIPTHDQNLQKLANIYILHYKNKEDLINTTEILEEYQLSTNDRSKAAIQWQLLADNIQLKQNISAYQQNAGAVEFKARKMALGQQEIAAKLVRSYIKEQYFWEWLHLTAESIECK